jgi:hypothetical protein
MSILGNNSLSNSCYFNNHSIVNAVFGLISYYVFSLCLCVLLIIRVFFLCFCALWLLFQHINNKELNVIMQGL